ncbi:MAG: transposase [Nitrospirales bacterium]|nr:transposase [Nitrospirales bacterium]
MEPRRTYSQEFKQEAIQLTKQAGGAITQVAKNLGMNAAMLGRRGSKAFPRTGTPHNQERARLKRELALVTGERDFLKEAAAFFAKTSREETPKAFATRWTDERRGSSVPASILANDTKCTPLFSARVRNENPC